ncbi:MAG: hypothetical protein ACE5G7_03180 [Candidatus Hydrothermarchaeaceae archaeon]
MLKRTVVTNYLRVLPHDGGLLLNDIPAGLKYVTRHDYRMDLEGGGKAAFLVEHVLGCLLLAGITTARVYGTSGEYDRTRQTHRDAEARGLPPSVVLGNPNGILDAGLYEALKKSSTGEPASERRIGVEREAAHSYPHGSIRVSPSDHLSIEVLSGDLSYFFELDDEEKILEVVSAETPYIRGLTEDTMPHVVGDVVGDIVGIGGINCADIEIHPGREYHRITIGVLKKLVKVEL